MTFGNVYELHPSGDKAFAVNGAQNVALSLAITISNIPRTLKEMPTTGPFTSAIKSFELLMNALTNFLVEKKDTQMNKNNVLL